MLNMAPSIYCNQPQEVVGLLEALKQYINGESVNVLELFSCRNSYQTVCLSKFFGLNSKITSVSVRKEDVNHAKESIAKNYDEVLVNKNVELHKVESIHNGFQKINLMTLLYITVIFGEISIYLNVYMVN